jgi:uncharacterized protein
MPSDLTYTAFAGHRRIASGDLKTAVLQTKAQLDDGELEPILVFEDQTGAPIDFDLRGTPAETLERLSRHPRFAPPDPQTPARTGPGRPRLGVVCREVSLLPRHWVWLEQHPGGVSGALRRLIDQASGPGQGADRARRAREAASKFMWVMAGNFPNFEEATRALFAKDDPRLEELIRAWPGDIRDYVERLVREAARLDDTRLASAASIDQREPAA